MGRAPCCDKADVKRGPWSPEEDAKLKAHIEQYGTGDNWIALPHKIGLKRCGKSCRLRWLNYLRPNLKHGGFSEEEDNLICTLYISIGTRWSIIAAQLPGRTDNDIKNYWNTRLKKKLLGRRKEQPKMDPRDGLSNSALERLQLHNHFCLYNNVNNVPALWPNLHATNFPLMETSVVPTPQHDKDLGFSEPSAHNMSIMNDEMSIPKSELLEQMLEGEVDNVMKDAGGNELDCLSRMWWSNESTSSNSWALHSDHGMFQDYVSGYNM